MIDRYDPMLDYGRFASWCPRLMLSEVAVVTSDAVDCAVHASRGEYKVELASAATKVP